MKMNPAECDQADCEAAALRQAIAGLLPFCASPVLRRALAALVNRPEDAAAIAVRRSQQARSAANPAAVTIAEWDGLRTRVVTRLAELGLSRQDLAAATGINGHTLRTYLAASGPPGGQDIARKLEAWLQDTAVDPDEAIKDELKAPEVAASVPFRGNEADRSRSAGSVSAGASRERRLSRIA